MAFQLVKYGMAGGCHMMEILYGRKFSIDELFSQPVKEICAQSLVYDNEIEKEHIRQQEMASKKQGGNLVIGSKNVNDILFAAKFPEDANAIVTLLTTKEYEEQIAKSKNND